MSLIAALCLACSAQVTQAAQNYGIDQIMFAFRTGVDNPDLLARTQTIYKTSKATADQQKALFLLGRQYQRSYEKTFMVAPKSADHNTLMSAYKQYDSYIHHRGWSRSEWLSDVRFYKAFFFLENNQLRDAQNTLRDMKPELDPTIFVDDIVWTQNRSFSVLQSYDAGKLRDVLADSIKRHLKDPSIDVRVQGVAADLRAWCRSMRYGKGE
jgi:hypothetical protein